MIKRILVGLVGCLLLGTLGVGGAAYYTYRTFVETAPSQQHQETILSIPRGASARKIGRLLQAEGVVTDARKFYYYVRLEKAASRIKAGELRFFTDLTPPQVLEILIKGEEVRYKVTFPEGYRITEMTQVIRDSEVGGWIDADRFEQLALEPQTARTYGFPTETLEGFLFPSTYHLARSQDASDLIQAMVRQFKSHWSGAFEARARALKMSQLEVVTLASIVEKETGHPKERGQVASVFHNRLKIGMPLQSDPTIIYGLKNYDGNIRRNDIRRPHPWNTYVIPGLPPSPIANPGLGALKATLWPAQTKYLYFVARGDRTHAFSKTYAEHARKVYKYQVQRRR